MKILTIKSFLFFLFFFSSFNILLAQPGKIKQGRPIGEGQGDPTSNDIHPNSCNMTLPMDIYLANLDGNTSDPFFNLPSTAAPIYLEYSFSTDSDPANSTQVAIVGPLGSFEYFDDINNIQVFKKTIQSYNIDISGNCIELPHNQESFVLYNHMRLTMQVIDPETEGISYVDYPACQNNGINEIFSCRAFYYAGLCSGLVSQEGDSDNNSSGADTRAEDDGGPGWSGICNNDALTKYSHAYDIFCPDAGCGDDDLGVGFINNGTNNEANILDLQVSPNPFDDNLKIQWSAKQDLEGLSLYNINGSVVRTWNKNQLGDLTSLELSTNELTKGIYFLQVNSSLSNEVIKIVKQ